MTPSCSNDTLNFTILMNLFIRSLFRLFIFRFDWLEASGLEDFWRQIESRIIEKKLENFLNDKRMKSFQHWFIWSLISLYPNCFLIWLSYSLDFSSPSLSSGGRFGFKEIVESWRITWTNLILFTPILPLSFIQHLCNTLGTLGLMSNSRLLQDDTIKGKPNERIILA